MQVPKRKGGLRSGACTSVGQVRENNEDTLFLEASDEHVLAVVADGMGGAVAGEEASRLAVEAIKSGLASLPADDATTKFKTEQVAQKLRTAIRSGNDSIVQRSSTDPDLRGMGTTVTLAFIRYTDAIIAHVGDSRAYLISSYSLPQIRQITDDHSFVEALVHAGHLTEEQAEDHPMRNVLYRALGQTEELDVDVYHTRLRPGDRIVLCSDGLTRHVKAPEIAQLVLEKEDPKQASEALVAVANERGGEDNISVIVVIVDGEIPTDETPMVLMAVPPTIIEEDNLDTVPVPRVTEEEMNPLHTLDGSNGPSPELPDENDTLPDRDQLDKRARLLQLQWLVDEVMLIPDPRDNAIANRAQLVRERGHTTRRSASSSEDGLDEHLPEK
jgi:protein phosphatase